MIRLYQNKAPTHESRINFAPGITKQRPAKSSSPALLPHGGNAAQTCPPPCRAPEAPEENNHLLPQGYRPMRWAEAQVDEPAPSTPSRNGSPLTSPAGRLSYRAETAVAGPGLRRLRKHLLMLELYAKYLERIVKSGVIERT